MSTYGKRTPVKRRSVKTLINDGRAGFGTHFATASLADKSLKELARPKLDLDPEVRVRVGRFVISKQETKPKKVAFETEAGTRLQISLLDE